MRWRTEINNSFKIPHIETLDELLSLPSSLFLRAAYQHVLGREVDDDGLLNYMKALSNGFGKKSILISLMNSDEARRLVDKNRLGGTSTNLGLLSNELAQLCQVHNRDRGARRIFRSARSGNQRKELNQLEFKLEGMFLSLLEQVKSEVLEEITHHMKFDNKAGSTAQSNLHTVNVIQAQRRSVSRPVRED